MVAEILSFHHVIFHPTEHHDLRTNHRAIKNHRDILEKMCERHGVPVLPVLAITSWENSGGIDKVSGANAAGLGQMTWGAVDEAHRYATRKAQKLKDEAKYEKYHGNVTKDQKRIERAEELYRKANAAIQLRYALLSIPRSPPVVPARRVPAAGLGPGIGAGLEEAEGAGGLALAAGPVEGCHLALTGKEVMGHLSVPYFWF